MLSNVIIEKIDDRCSCSTDFLMKMIRKRRGYGQWSFGICVLIGIGFEIAWQLWRRRKMMLFFNPVLLFLTLVCCRVGS